MLAEQRYAEATRIIKDIKLYEFFNLPPLMTTLLNEDKLAEATALVTDHIELQKVKNLLQHRKIHI